MLVWSAVALYKEGRWGRGRGLAHHFNSRIISLSKGFGEFEQKSPATFVEFLNQHKRTKPLHALLGGPHLYGIHFEIILMGMNSKLGRFIKFLFCFYAFLTVRE